jgi:DNA polymerase III psi subunit
MHTKTVLLKITWVMTVVTMFVVVPGCLSSSRTDEYFVGLTPGQLELTKRPLEVGLMLAVPEIELQKTTGLNPENQTRLIQHIAEQLRQATAIEVKKVLPTITLPGNGTRSLSLDRLREIAKQAQVPYLIAVVPSSRSAQKVQPYPLIETELFARLDAALIDLPRGRVLLTETGEEYYILGERRDVARTIGYPRIYYRTQTTKGPFTVLDGDLDPQVELGKTSFTAAADQLVMRLLNRLKQS